MNLYAATAIVNDDPTGAFLIAKDPDDAASKAMARLPEGGKLTHVIRVCEARLSTLQRNKLVHLVPENDRIEFVSKTLLDIIAAMHTANNAIRSVVGDIHRFVTEKLELKQFAFTVTESNGVLQQHNCFHRDLASATSQAEQFAKDHYGESAELTSIEEIQ